MDATEPRRAACPQGVPATPVQYGLFDDTALVCLVGVHDAQALDALYNRYSRPVFSLALKIVGDREVTEDVVQEVFLRLWTRAGGYSSARGKLLSWLLTITHHRAIDELRRRRARPQIGGLEEGVAAIEEPGADPATLLACLDECKVVRWALAQLPEQQRQPIVLAYYGGLTQGEIVRALKALSLDK
ncbi:MAG: sigma-70 family RNA polymerase sigma factor [Chloroflexi bacterium]|nr:sigma-70 family RNA polymerase sigma factor [Chloroflexota bacterium]